MPKPHVICFVREALTAKKRTQEWLATELDVDPAIVSRIVRGYRNPRVTFARRVARLLNTTVEALWPESTPKRRK